MALVGSVKTPVTQPSLTRFSVVLQYRCYSTHDLQPAIGTLIVPDNAQSCTVPYIIWQTSCLASQVHTVVGLPGSFNVVRQRKLATIFQNKYACNIYIHKCSRNNLKRSYQLQWKSQTERTEQQTSWMSKWKQNGRNAGRLLQVSCSTRKNP